MSSPAYHRIVIQNPPGEGEIVQAVLYENGCLGLEELETGLKAYFEAHGTLAELEARLREAYPRLIVVESGTFGLVDTTFRPATFDAFELVPGVLVRPPKDLGGSGQGLIIRPGLAFGTGRHETTRLVAEALSRITPAPLSLLDVGTGSGILAIYARSLGIQQVDAVEIDEAARDNARENFHLNGCQEIGLFSDVSQCRRHYDVVLANLLTPTLLHLRDPLVSLLHPTGRLILSGITEDEAPQILSAFSDLTPVERGSLPPWVGLVLLKNS